MTKITIADIALDKADMLVVTAFEDAGLAPTAARLDDQCGGRLKQAMTAAGFTGKKGRFVDIYCPAGLDAKLVVIAGLGKASDLDGHGAEAAGGDIVAHLDALGVAKAALVWDGQDDVRLDASEGAARAAFGARLRGWRFDRYRTRKNDDQPPRLEKLTVMTANKSAARKVYNPLDKVAEGVFLARELASEPANVLVPSSYAQRCRSALEPLGVEIEILDEKDMRKLGMGALLGVAQGSANSPRTVVMHWRGGGKKDAPLAFIGKGVTFDSGGISIKPANGMEDMKWDMAGSAAVVGAMAALAGRKAKVNAIGLIGLVENMPSGTAQRPGDVVTSLSGQTVEVINTDAEGRLVLADVMWYAQDRHKPRLMVDLATLTGAIIVALGNEHAGLFTPDDQLAQNLLAASKTVGEGLWRLPLGDAYDKLLESDIADMKNVGGREGGAITAAQFLKRFTNEVPWAHLDIAGTAWAKKDASVTPKGGTGFGVRLLDRLVAEFYEGKS